MADWTSGYVADLDYTFGYYSELNPLRVKLAFLNAGIVFPEFGNACELGFGQGLSANIHAAASCCSWTGTDFNPSQASFAKELASASGLETKLYDESFQEFYDRSDLPNFDYIGLHGIWSWISDENRKTIVDFIKRKLNVGGVLYVSYNTLPGWGAFAPMRHLMTEHAEIIGSEGAGIVNKINAAIDFSEKLLNVDPMYSRANPLIGERMKQLKGQNRNYLAHEYFNRDWNPMHFSTFAKWLEPAKVQFVCSATYPDYIDALNLKEDQLNFLNSIPDRMFRESVRDFMVNQQFRKDYWVKGARVLSPMEKLLKLRGQKIILTQYMDDKSLKIKGVIGEVSLQESVYIPLLNLMSDHKIRSFGEIELALKDILVFPQIIQAIIILTGIGVFSPVQDEETVTKVKKQTDKLNLHILQKVKEGYDIGYLASPVLGGGCALNRFQQLFLVSIIDNSDESQKDDSELWVSDTWKILEMQGQKISKNGMVLQTEGENIEELKDQANNFKKKILPIIRSLKVI